MKGGRGGREKRSVKRIKGREMGKRMGRKEQTDHYYFNAQKKHV